ncbi:hypothetical protein EMIT093MI4_90171 [Pseudomonas sp. IT-93MI4]
MAFVAADHRLCAAVWLGADGEPDVENPLKSFASKPAPTFGMQFKCGSGLAREWTSAAPNQSGLASPR